MPREMAWGKANSRGVIVDIPWWNIGTGTNFSLLK